jgi:hypothetical protein
MKVWFFEINYVGFSKRLSPRKIEKAILAEWKRTRNFVECVKFHKKLTDSYLMVSKAECERILKYDRETGVSHV